MEHQTFTLPDHVKQEQVVDFDMNHVNALHEDIHLGLNAIYSQVPDIFYTLHNGGHWVVKGFDMVRRVTMDSEHFSTAEIDIPKVPSENKLIPLNLDPPDHAPYRAMLLKHFSAKTVAALEPTLRAWAARLIEQARPDGGCDFTENLGAGFPVSVFMEMMGLPMDRFAEFREIVTEYFEQITPERRRELQEIIVGEVEALIEARRAEPRDDLISHLVQERVRDRLLTQKELNSICFLLVIAGLDTVANMLTFSTYHLARNAELQARLHADPSLVPAFVEECLRRYAVVNAARMVKKDIEIDGYQFRAGEMVMCALPAAGLDPRKNDSPETFSLDRENRAVMPFSAGPHLCLGHFLARAEMRVFFEEWTRRIPRFDVAPGFTPDYRVGFVMAIPSLPLKWQPG